MSKILKIIKKQHPLFRDFLYDVVPFSFRYGKDFNKTLNFLKKSQNWRREDLLEYQNNQLKNLLIHSYETVSYYENLFNEYDLDPYTFKDNEEIKKLPLLTKDIINSNFESLISTKFKNKNVFSPTS